MVDLNVLHTAAAQLAATIRGLPRGSRWFIDCDTDADGLCAAAVMTAALRRTGHRVQVRPSRDKHTAHYTALADAPGDALMLLDKGTSHMQDLPRDRPVVVVDHHNVPGDSDHVRLLNPRALGLDGSRHASASTTAAALALALVGDDALRHAPTALAGAIGDWQHRPEWIGWNLELLERARAAGTITSRRRPDLVGVDLQDAARRKGLPPAALAHADVDGTQEVDEVAPEVCTTVVSALALRHLAEGKSGRAVRALVCPEDHHAYLDAPLRTVFRTVDACGRLGDAGTGLAYLLGDPAASAKAHTLFAAYRGHLREALDLLPATVQEAQAFRHATTPLAALTGMVAGLAMETGRVPDDKPLCVLAGREDGQVQVSTRGLAGHVDAGLDLGASIRSAAHAVGAEGGGHPVAAGAVIPAGSEARFLAALDTALTSRTTSRTSDG